MLPTRRVALTTQPSRKRVKCQFYTASFWWITPMRTRLIHNAQSLSAGVYEKKKVTAFHHFIPQRQRSSGALCIFNYICARGGKLQAAACNCDFNSLSSSALLRENCCCCWQWDGLIWRRIPWNESARTARGADHELWISYCCVCSEYTLFFGFVIPIIACWERLHFTGNFAVCVLAK